MNKQFNPNEGSGGFEEGAYDLNAIQPEWTNWTGQSRFVGPEKPKIKWKVQMEDSFAISPFAIDKEGNVYVGDDNGNLFLIKIDGKFSCIYKADKGLRVPVLGQDGTIYVGTKGAWSSKGHKLCAINADGTLRWTYIVDDIVAGSPVINKNGDLYIVTNTGHLLSISKEGNQLWMLKKNVFWSEPVIAKSGVLYIGSDKNLYAIDKEGNEIWESNIGLGVAKFTPVIGCDETLYLCTEKDKDWRLLALDINGNVKWSYKPDNGRVVSNPSLGKDGTLYIRGDLFRLMAIDCLGNLQWETNTEGFITSRIIIGADNTVYVSSTNKIKGKSISWIYAIGEEGVHKWVLELKGEIVAFTLSKDKTIYVLVSKQMKDKIKLRMMWELYSIST